jgi:hypothetical protein
VKQGIQTFSRGPFGGVYLRMLPAHVPADQALVHNHVRPTRRLGSRGFRAWLCAPSEWLEVCRCGWAPELGPHFRVRRVDSSATH